MSVWCEKCQKTTFNEKKCDHCGQNPKKEVKTYRVPKNNGVRIVTQKKTNKNTKLTNCRTCENPISKNAETCPHCGEVSPLNAKEYAKTGIIKFVAIIVMAFLLYQVVTYQLKDLPQKIQQSFNHKK